MPDRNQDAFVLLQRAAERLMGDVHALLKPYGLSPTQYNVLRILRGAQPKGLRCGEVSARMIQREPDMTRLLDRLERRGLIQRTRSAEDRRVVVTQIAPPGLALLQEIDQPMLALHARQFRPLGEKKTRDLVRTLNLLLEL